MKRRDLIIRIKKMGCVLIRHGNHDWYQNSLTGICQPVPRHRKINDKLAKHIIKILS